MVAREPKNTQKRKRGPEGVLVEAAGQGSNVAEFEKCSRLLRCTHVVGGENRFCWVDPNDPTAHHPLGLADVQLWARLMVCKESSLHTFARASHDVLRRGMELPIQIVFSLHVRTILSSSLRHCPDEMKLRAIAQVEEDIIDLEETLWDPMESMCILAAPESTTLLSQSTVVSRM